MKNEQITPEENATEHSTSDRRRSFLKGLASIPAVGAFSSLFTPGKASAAMNGSVYNLKGRYFESCSCTTAVCPCLFLQDPTEGYCKAFPSWHIEEGNLGDVRLDGLNVAAWLHSPGPLTQGNWRLALYIDENATDDQYNAIEELWGGTHGGHLQVIASLVSEYLGSTAAKISWKEDGNTRIMSVEGVGGVEIEAYEGADGKNVTLHDTPLAIAPPHPITINKSTRWSYQDNGIDMLLSGTAGLASDFTYSV
ncbi:MAG: DUF1326 domain-containing protein [Acidiferrobacterales bacterium]|nr:DUF1326 domain-containing protein [Acidiferrobacterales bacterium]